jgi:SAM-dependent methyltransferase
MIEAARREAGRRGLDNASFEVALVDHLRFAANSFDAVVSRFGVMFFPSPLNAIREALRVLKPGGKIAMAVWHFAASNPFHYTLAEIVEKHVASEPPPADSPDAFRFAEPGKLLALFSEAGVSKVSERLLRFPIQAPLAVEQFWALRSEMSEKLRTKLARLSPQQLGELEREVIEALGAYSSERGMEFPAEVLIVSGRKELG